MPQSDDATRAGGSEGASARVERPREGNARVETCSTCSGRYEVVIGRGLFMYRAPCPACCGEAAVDAAAPETPDVPLERAWRLWVWWVSGNPTSTADIAKSTADLEAALDRAPTSELIALFTRGVIAEAQDRYPTRWSYDSKPLADEIDRRIPRRRA
jgi:hypothetical protein